MRKMTIELPCYKMVIKLNGKGGTISSGLSKGSSNSRNQLKTALDAIESIVLAHAIAEVNIESPAYIEGIETAVDAAFNNLT